MNHRDDVLNKIIIRGGNDRAVFCKVFLTGSGAEYLYLQENESAYRAATVPFQQLDRQVNRGGATKYSLLCLAGLSARSCGRFSSRLLNVLILND